MNKIRPLPVAPALSLLLLLVTAMPGLPSFACSAAVSEAEAAMLPGIAPVLSPEAISYSPGISELMRSSRAKYLAGSDLIKAGDLEGARTAFDEAVDMLLHCGYDLASTPSLNKFFHDLIRRIQQDESMYLIASFDVEEEIENLAVEEIKDLDLIPVTLDPDVQHVLALELANTEYEIPITINETVLKSLNFWLNRGRDSFEAGLIRSGQYRSMIEKIFREESIPLDLLYLAQVESSFKPHAVSKARAKGIWQFEKATAIRYGLKVTRDVDERSDPEKSTRAAARYLNDLFAMFKDWNLALAAYNWGEGKVRRLINNTGINDFWKLSDLKRKLPAETKNHVPLIQASVILGRNAEKYGLPTELDPPLQYTEVSVSKPIDLRAAAKVLSTSIEELKKLNPALRGLTTPANYPNFQLKVPSDIPPEIEDQLASLPSAKVRAIVDSDCRHKVRPGETLSGIARKYRTTVSKLRKANGFSSKSILRAGSWIRLPDCSDDEPQVASSKKGGQAKKSTKSVSSKKKTKKPAKAAAETGTTRKSPSASAESKAGASKEGLASVNRAPERKAAA